MKLRDGTEQLLSYEVNAEGLNVCVSNIMRAIEAGERRWLACLNPHSYVMALDRPDFHEALLGADWLIPDGSGVVLASRLKHGRIRERVTGSDIFHRINEHMQRIEGSVFFLGSTKDNLSLIRERMTRDWPRVRVVGAVSPPFKSSFSSEENEEIVRAINAVRPTVLWVGMSAPKQEVWIHQMLPELDVHFAGAIGAVFDFYAGRIPRSSLAFQRVGLEWLPRLLREPVRLWPRTFVSAPRFLWHVFRRSW